MNDIKKFEKSIANIRKTLESDNKEIKEHACESVEQMLKDYGVPITGGNMYQAIMYKNAINKAFNVDNNGNVSLSTDNAYFPNKMTIRHYFELLNQAKYWQNLFIIQNWDELTPENQKAIKIGFAVLYIFGYIGWYKENDKLIPCILTGKIKCDEYGYPKECDGYPAGMCFQFGVMDFNYSDRTVNVSDKHEKSLSKFKKQLNRENCVFGKWNTWGYGAWILETPFINTLIKYLDRVDTASALTGLMLKQKSIDGKSRGVEQILDNHGIISEVTGAGGTFSDKFEVMDVGSSGATLKQLIDTVEWYRQWYYSMEGRRYNINEKQERNINSEVMYSQLNFDVLENEHLRELTITFNEIKEKFKIDVQISSPIVADDIENQENYNELNSENNVETKSETLNGGK